MTDKIKEQGKEQTAEEILEFIIKNNKDKEWSNDTYVEDYAGGSRRYILESLVFEAIEYASQKQPVLPTEKKKIFEDYDICCGCNVGESKRKSTKCIKDNNYDCWLLIKRNEKDTDHAITGN